MPEFTFVIPEPADFISGGNSYNRQLVDAIHVEGGSVSHISYEQFKTSASDKTCYVFDTIYFESIQKDGLAVPSGSIGLIHHLESLYPLSEKVFALNDLPVLQKFAGFVVSSHFTKSYILSHGLDSPIVVIEPAFHVSKRSTIPQKGKLNALMVNNIVPRKGILPFLKALAYEKMPPYYRLQIVGDLNSDPAYARSCMEIVRQDSLLKRTVKFKGLQDDLTLKKMHEKSSLFVSASYMETFGMAIQEASVHGLPLLVLEGGNAANHVVEGRNGWAEKSMEKLVKRFAGLANNPDLVIEIQQKAHSYRHPYMTSYRDGAKFFLEFTNRF